MENITTNGNITTDHNNDFYAAIMDEDVGRIEELSKTYGSNYFIEIHSISKRKIFLKGISMYPLHLAATYRRVKSMKSLLLAGADPEIRDNLGRTTLHLVVDSWPRMMVCRHTECTKFHIVCMTAHSQAEACLRLLCEHGVNINAEVKGATHQTALHLSAWSAALSAVRILTSYGANVNAVDRMGMVPLHSASGTLHKDIIINLIKHGADINMQVEQSGNTPLHLAGVGLAIKSTQPLEDGISCITELLEHGADPNIMNTAGMTPLHEACIMGNSELVDLLLSYGANVNKLSEAGENCLFMLLNNSAKVKESSLLSKLLGLTSPLTVYNQNGQLPSTLTLPCFSKQRDQLLKITQQPRRLQDICKRVIYLHNVREKREELRKILPGSMYEFIFNYWDII
uniref:Uncharacterized protein n=2 Tax=Sphaeramia orbicularis TaxID=375764 RepID=A0A673AIF5_9TELE